MQIVQHRQNLLEFCNVIYCKCETIVISANGSMFYQVSVCQSACLLADNSEI